MGKERLIIAFVWYVLDIMLRGVLSLMKHEYSMDDGTARTI